MTATSSLASGVAHLFSHTSKSRGIAYFGDGRVRLVARDGTQWTLEVQGTRVYRVQLSTARLAKDPGTCTCPAFDESGSCKHQWASILELDLLLCAHSKLGAASPMFKADAAGDVVGWRDRAARALCHGSFWVDLWGDGRAVGARNLEAAERGATASEMAAQIGDDDELDGDSFDHDDDLDDDDLDDDELDDDDLDDDDLDDALDELEQDLATDGKTLTHGPSPLALRVPPPLDEPLDWQSRLLVFRRAAQLRSIPRPQALEATFLIDGTTARKTGDLEIWIALRKQHKNGRMGVWRLPRRHELEETTRALPALRVVPHLLSLSRPSFRANYVAEPIRVTGALVDVAITGLSGSSLRMWPGLTGRARLPDELPPEVALDGGPPFSLAIAHRHSDDGERSIVAALAERGQERIAHDDVVAVLPGWILTDQRLVRCDMRDAYALCRPLLVDGPLDVPTRSESEVFSAITPLLGSAPVQSTVLAIASDVAPLPVLSLDKPEPHGRRIEGQVRLAYGTTRVAPGDARALLVEGPRLVRRDAAREQAALAKLREVCGTIAPDGACSLTNDTFTASAHALLADGWRIEAAGRPVQRSGTSTVAVTSSTDWFDVAGTVEFDGHPVQLPTLLRARTHPSGLVELGDGAFGLLPERWLERWQTLLALGEAHGSALRLRSPQAWVIDMLVADRAADTVKLDTAYRKRQERLRSFAGIGAVREPATFAGELRPYQRQGLGWLHFLQEFALGGCLADDMGLGKTAQVLALLAGRKRGRAGKPTLVVAPRSVVFHWREEAARFAPALRVREHVGLQRWTELAAEAKGLHAFDVVLTTYGTMVRDIGQLAGVEFHTIVLDEANAIKNARSQRAKAALALRADHRLALSGTPIENSLDELWSLFEFLNPGMLGRATAFRELVAQQRASRGPTATTASFGERLRDVLRPFFLRRTKETVLDDLPQKTEQVVRCHLEGDQRRDYEQFRDHFRMKLRAKIASHGLAKSKMHVLEALLRLRQIACHRGLIDKALRQESSAKLESLLPMLDDVVRSGHKALVFSQFTAFLDIVRSRLTAQGLTYEYLDGQTTKRQAAVNRFQNDADCKVFLLSLKAGGVGLNLTAADYVFLLDPWWNPAVETQAIDRAHRIGQTRRVFAYRLIARDTIEEKLLELQRDKRALAAALFAADGSPLQDLTAEDLERLLS
jgi:hypothetical protein